KTLLADAKPGSKPSYAIAWTRPLAHVFRIIREHPDDAPLFHLVEGRCAEAVGYTGRYFVVGSEVGPGDFVAFDRRMSRTPAAPDRMLRRPVDSSRATVDVEQAVGTDGTVTRAV